MTDGRYQAVNSDTELNPLPPPGYVTGPSDHSTDSSYDPHAPPHTRSIRKGQRPSLKSQFDFPKDHGYGALGRLLFPWVWTILLTVTLVVVVKVYEGKGVITSHQKDSFNGLTTALILLLGLSFFEAFKALARNLRDRIQVWFQPPERAKPMVDGFDNLLQVAQLIYTRAEGVTLGLRIFGVVWIALCVVALGASALISLTYSIDDGNDYNTVYTRHGNPQTTNLTCFGVINNTAGCPSPITAQTLAHAYGQTILATPPGDYGNLSTTKNPDEDYPYYSKYPRENQFGGQEFAYRFKEYNQDDSFKAYPHFTNRIIRASSGDCVEYPEIVDERKEDKIGFVSATKFTYRNGTTNGTITIPLSSQGREGTTYIYDGFHPPESADLQRCGDRCLLMWAYRNEGSRQDPTFFRCPITITEVSNATREEQKISEGLARIAAASISLQGQFTPADGDFRKPLDQGNFRQFQFFANGHPWEIHYHNASKVGANLAESAIGSLATMVTRNTKIEIPGTVPHLGSRLRVRWKYFEPLLILIVVAHTMLILLNYLATQNSSNR